MKTLAFTLIAIILLLGIGFIVLPSPIDAAAYQPPEAPTLSGPYLPNHDIDQAILVGKGSIPGSEDVDIDAQGRLYGATADGRIIRVTTDENNKSVSIETLANTGGRPLGLHWDKQHNLIICDAFKGLLSLSPSGELTTLLTEVDGQTLVFTDDLEITQNGIMYFTDASIKYDQKHYMLDMLEARPWGRLIEYNPTTKQARTLLDGLYFANGVAISPNEDFVLVNETYRYRITRYWIAGPKQGQSDIFIENLPGFPDGISSTDRSTFWVALPTTRNAQADAMHPHPFLKNQVAKLPESMRPKPEHYGLAIELNAQGEVLRSLHDPEGDHFPFITSVQERNEVLYLGSLIGDSIGILPLSTIATLPSDNQTE